MLAENVESTSLTFREKSTLGLLCLINVVNYMDRFGVAGILMQIEEYYEIEDDLAGLLQSALIVAYLASAPVFGYMGDRYSRKLLLMMCTLCWALSLVTASFCTMYWQFLLCRSLMGVFQSGFTTISPTIISDIVMNAARSKVLAIYNVAIPLGSGLGYIVSSSMAHVMGQWQWGLRLTPLVNCFFTLLLFFGAYPERGEKEATALGGQRLTATSYMQDVVYLLHNISYLLVTFGLTCVTFVTGALAFWAPKCLYYGFKLIENRPAHNGADVMLLFGTITVIAGIFGAISGTILSLLLRPIYPWIDPIICGTGFLLALPLLTGALFLAAYNEAFTYVLIFFGQWTMNFNWPIVADMLMYVVVPTRRSTALALQMFTIHACGDLWSPYIVGLLSEEYKNLDYTRLHDNVLHRLSERKAEDKNNIFHRLQLSLLTITSVHLLSIILFMVSAIFIQRDREAASFLSANN